MVTGLPAAPASIPSDSRITTSSDPSGRTSRVFAGRLLASFFQRQTRSEPVPAAARYRSTDGNPRSARFTIPPRREPSSPSASSFSPWR